MTAGNEPRRKRRSDSFRRDEAEEADNWLAGLRGSGRGEPDPFAAPPPEPAPFDHPSFERPGPMDRPGPFDPPGPLDRSGSFDRPGPLERPSSFDRPGPLERSGSFERGSFDGRGGAGGVDHPAAYESPSRPNAPGRAAVAGREGRDGPGRASGRRSQGGAGDSPSGVFGPGALPPAAPPARPVLDARSAPDSTQELGGRRRARDDESPSGVSSRADATTAFSRDGNTPSGTYGRGADATTAFNRSTDARGADTTTAFSRGTDSPGRGSDGAFGRDGDTPSGSFSRGADGAFGRGGDTPSGSFGRAALPARPASDQQATAQQAPTPAESRGGRRRARDDDDPAGHGPSESYDHGPELTPIIKPLADFTPVEASSEPPPLVPIFPSMRPDAAPTSGAASTGRRARRAAEEDASTHTGEVGGDRRGRAADDTGVRRQRSGLDFAEEAAGTRTGELGGGRRRARAADDSGEFRAGDDHEATGNNGFGAAGRPEETTAFRRDQSRAGGRSVADPGAGEPGRNGFEPGRNGFEPGRNGFEATGRNGFGAAARAGETTAFRRDRPGYDDEPGSTRAGELGAPRRDRDGYDDDPDGFRRDDTGAGRRGRAGFEAAAPAETDRRRDDSGVRRREEALRRRPPLDDPMPGGYDEPGRRPGDGRRGTGEYTGDFTSGGTNRRALREPPGRPPGPPGRSGTGERPAGRPVRGATGTQPRPAVDPVRPEHRPHRWIALLSVIAVLVVLGACAIGTWFIFKDERNGPESTRSGETTGPKKRDISSRQVDPAPLTEAEVFPNNNIVAAPNEPPYVILATKASPDCKVAATDQLATLLMGAGCSEVVRATMKSPNEEYLITAGLFNLVSEQAAEQAFNGVKPIVDGQKGRFAGMSVGVGTGTDAVVRAPTQLGWNFKGHFIAYCVIARVDGNAFKPDDPYPNQITFDIVETYLEGEIIGARATIQPEATPAASLPASAPPN